MGAGEDIAAKAQQLGYGIPHLLPVPWPPTPYPVQCQPPRQEGMWQRFTGGLVLWSPGTGAHGIQGAIAGKYEELGREIGVLGFPKIDETGTPDGIGRYNHFERGSIYWTPATGAHAVQGGIREKWSALGWERSPLGYPLTDETGTPDGIGRYNHFERGSIYWTAQTGAYAVQGGIREKWNALGWERSVLGYPLTDETAAPDGAGRYNHFQRGSIYWTAQSGAHEVHGAIREKWSALGWERSVLGYPLTDETTARDGAGRFNHFQRGSIYWTPATGAHAVHGGIREKWSALGWERSVLGYPLTDETTARDGAGRFNHFQSGSIYWTAQTGANEVHGAIRDKWNALGSERGLLGYPLSDERATPDSTGRYNHFQNGSIYWTPETGAHEVHGAIRAKWAELGWERSTLGYPVSDELASADGTGRYSDFQYGRISWTPTGGAVVDRQGVRVQPRQVPLGGDYWQGGYVIEASPGQVAPVWGFADVHTHPVANLGFGGKLFYGSVDGPIEQALKWCDSAHGPGGVGWFGDVGNVFMTFFEGGFGHLVGGFPQFDGWPNFRTRVHQQMYVDWIRRAFDGGLRLMVTLAVNNQLLAHEFGGQDFDDRQTVEVQLAAIKDIAGRHAEWMEIAYTPADARRIIRADKLCLILGVEVDALGEWRRPGDATEAVVADYLRHLYADLGVRHIFPIHLANNALGGTAVYNDLFNVLNRYLHDDYYDVEDASASGVQFRLLEAEGAPEGWYRASGYYAPPDYHGVAGGHANRLGITPLGRAAITQMMRLGMIVDIDHMSQRAINDTLSLAEMHEYPLVAGHAGFRDLAWRRGETASPHKCANEFHRTPDDLRRLRALGGMVGVGLHQGDIRSAGSAVANDAAGSSKAWAQAYVYARQRMGYRGIAIGTDMNGLPGSAGPRFGMNACRDLDDGDDPSRRQVRRQQVFTQQNGVRYATPIVDYRSYRFEGKLQGELFDDEEKEIWEASAIAKSGTDSQVADITGVRLPWQVGKIRNLAFGLMATSEGQLASGFRLPGDNTVNEQRAAFLVKSRRSADGENDEVKRLVGRIQPIWDRWAAMEGNNPPLQRSLAGRRDFDVNLDGVAHYGLLPDFLQDLKNVGLDTAALATLFRSAEDYIRMWETCDVRKGRI